ELRARRVAVLRNLGFFVFFAIRIGLIAAHFPLAWFAAAQTLELGFVGAALAWSLRREGLALSVEGGLASECRRLLGESWPLIISGLAVAGFSRLDQVLV